MAEVFEDGDGGIYIRDGNPKPSEQPSSVDAKSLNRTKPEMTIEAGSSEIGRVKNIDHTYDPYAKC